MNLVPTPAQWLPFVLADFDSFLADHASCEKKASGMALSIASHYPDKPQLLQAMAELAVEELTHYREVIRFMLERGLTPAADVRDPYVRSLNGLIRRGPEHFLLDRLLVAAVVEKRGHERFSLLAEALEDNAARRFYRAIAASEDRHWQLFLRLAEQHCAAADIAPRLAAIVACEGDLVQSLPLRAALH